MVDAGGKEKEGEASRPGLGLLQLLRNATLGSFAGTCCVCAGGGWVC